MSVTRQAHLKLVPKPAPKTAKPKPALAKPKPAQASKPAEAARLAAGAAASAPAAASAASQSALAAAIRSRLFYPAAARARGAKGVVGVGGHHRTAKLKHQPAVEIEPESPVIRFTHRVRLYRSLNAPISYSE